MIRLIAIALLLLVVHGVLGGAVHNQRPALGILPRVPKAIEIPFLSFGDRQFLYRGYALQLQNAGDTGGRFTPMRSYPVGRVVQWLEVLRDLDSRSHFYPLMAVRYFSQTDDTDGLKLILRFIEIDAVKRISSKWYWLTQAVAVAKLRLRDDLFALELSRSLALAEPFIPSGYAWVIQIEPVLLADLGRLEEAKTRMSQIVATYGMRMTPPEREWTKDFIQELQNRPIQ